MPSFGICCTLDKVDAIKSAGFDHAEGAANVLFDGRVEDDAALDLDKVRQAALPIAACNMYLPGDDVTVTGPDPDRELWATYNDRLLRRAAECGVSRLVLGSGKARMVRDGQSRDEARERILDFLKIAAPLAARYGVTIVIEPLRRGECNIINSVAEGMEYVHAIDHPNVRCLVDSYHLWDENEPLENLEKAMPFIQHVHVADHVTRAGSGADPSQIDAYRAFFGVLKAGGYDGAISVEGTHGWDEPTLAGIRDFLHEQWNAA